MKGQNWGHMNKTILKQLQREYNTHMTGLVKFTKFYDPNAEVKKRNTMGKISDKWRACKWRVKDVWDVLIGDAHIDRDCWL